MSDIAIQMLVGVLLTAQSKGWRVAQRVRSAAALALRPAIVGAAADPLGSVIAVDGDIPAVDLRRIVERWRAAPWCPIVIVRRQVVPSQIELLLGRPGMIPGTLRLPPGERPTDAALRRAVWERPMPDSEDVAAYIGRRLGRLRGAIVTEALTGPAFGTGLRRRLHRRGLWPVRE